MTSGRVVFYVQHLLGIGHLRRARLIAEALAAAGFTVDLVSGGMPVPEFSAASLAGRVRLVQLPPLKAGPGGFGDLRDDRNRPLDGEWKAARRAKLLETVEAAQPDIVLVEAFPFGRRALRFELLPLLERLAGLPRRPLVACSVRDILVPSDKPGREEETLALLQAHFDLVLVHGDPALIGFEESFRRCPEIAHRLRYTGLVADPQAGSTPRGEAAAVLVSVGGGAVGGPLLEAALAARPLTAFAAEPWHLLCGPHLSPAGMEALRRAAAPGVTIEGFRTDFAALLAGCAVSVSQAGYNTVADILATGARAVLVPFAGPGETEQTVRALRLAERGRIEMLAEADLTPDALARAIDAAATRPEGTDAKVDLCGAARTAEILLAEI